MGFKKGSQQDAASTAMTCLHVYLMENFHEFNDLGTRWTVAEVLKTWGMWQIPSETSQSFSYTLFTVSNNYNLLQIHVSLINFFQSPTWLIFLCPPRDQCWLNSINFIFIVSRLLFFASRHCFMFFFPATLPRKKRDLLPFDWVLGSNFEGKSVKTSCFQRKWGCEHTTEVAEVFHVEGEKVYVSEREIY